MPWMETPVMTQRREFVHFASLEGANVSALCRQFGISRSTGYKWLRRAREGDESFIDRSRRPLRQPSRTPREVERSILAARAAHPAWGARKIRHWLLNRGLKTPSASTVHAILRRHGLIAPDAPGAPPRRFAQDEPNLLWQMDFKGRVPLHGGGWLHPLTVIDDHSRFCPLLEACEGERHDDVKPLLEKAFRRYGLPAAFYVDNGTPWGTATPGQWTRLGVWLLRLGVRVIHGRPYHPQGRGKIERFHRSLKAEALAMRPLRSMAAARRALDEWREVYNFERPHEALEMRTPAQLYRPSPRPFPEQIPQVRYDAGETVRKAGRSKAYVSFKNRLWHVPDAFRGELLAIRPTRRDGCFDICFGAVKIAEINLNEDQNEGTKCVNHVSEHL
jgi:transposase InsO family protein